MNRRQLAQQLLDSRLLDDIRLEIQKQAFEDYCEQVAGMDPDPGNSIEAILRAAHRHAGASEVVELFKVFAAAEITAIDEATH